MCELTLRQQSVCELVVLGLSNKEIAKELGISFRTVEDHKAEIYRRLKVRNAVELVRKIAGCRDERAG